MKILHPLFKMGINCLILSHTFLLHAQSEAFFGTQIGQTAYTMMYQNNYGQRLLKFNVETRHSLGLIGGLQWKRRHMFQIGLRRIEGSQTYYDNVFTKKLFLQYISIPLSYGYIFNPKKSVRTKFYISGGLSLNILTYAALSHYIHGKKTTLLNYATTNPFETYQWENPNSEQITSLLSNETDLHPNHSSMFNSYDVSCIGGLGIQKHMASNWLISAELFGMVSLADIHATKWRLPRGNGTSRNSYNLFCGIHISILYFLK